LAPTSDFTSAGRWLAGCLAGWLAADPIGADVRFYIDWLGGWLAGWLAGWLQNFMGVDRRAAGWLAGCRTPWTPT
jgi:fructose-specific phosphotransferase system IIC component